MNANWSILEKSEDRCFFSHPSSDLSEALMKQPKKSFTGKQARCISRRASMRPTLHLSVLPGTLGGMKAISVDNSAAMNMPDDAFS